MTTPTLSDGVVTLRAPGPGDADGSYEQCQDPASQRWTTVPLPYTRADAEVYLGQIIPGGWADGSEWAFVVEAEGRFAGVVALRDEGHGRAEIAFGAHPAARGRGLMERALRLLLDWGFAERQVAVVHWRAYVGNWASRRLAWRLGFTLEGTVRGLLAQRGELRDAWVGTLRRTDPRRPRETWLATPPLGGDDSGVLLRALRDDDAPRVLDGLGDPQTQFWLAFMPRDPGPAEAAAYLERARERQATGHSLTWALTDASDALLGAVGLYRLDADPELGYWTHPQARGRGLTRPGAALVVRHAFDTLGLERLEGHVATGNVASRRVLESLGFRPTGVRRAAARTGDGAAVDLAGYDLLAAEARSPDGADPARR